MDKTFKKLFERATAVGHVPADAIIVVQLAKGYDIKRDNEFWENERDRSQVRDIVCSHCLRQVVMSNRGYKDYLANDKKNEVICAEGLKLELNKRGNEKANATILSGD